MPRLMRRRNRSSCDSGSGNTPACSVGFCGAMTTTDSTCASRRCSRSVPATAGTTCEVESAWVAAAKAPGEGDFIAFRRIRTIALTDSVLEQRGRRTAWITHEACGLHEMGEG